MVKDPLIRDLVAILLPLPGKLLPEADLEYFEECERTLEATYNAREELAEQMAETAETADTDPLLTAITEASRIIDAQEEQRRLLFAYAREHVRGRPYSFDALGRAAGKPASTVRSSIKQADIDAVAELLGRAARENATVSAEEAAFQNMRGLLDRLEHTGRKELLADGGAQLRPLLAGLHEEAVERVIARLRGDYAEVRPRPGSKLARILEDKVQE
ncbi:hypothetical protein [Glycomyces paridis]|jgi:hypothetical protein|uniref:Uncharacterized protein n=1 Tax=Glycomyces paridis TaxID=2126555 RepID=A0A4V4HP84_9ACTN|nr:hypothetical protein [Glycomyces paridis]THV28996.1 hypothetical protein E9998_09595 [Glycomyces paridis]